MSLISQTEWAKRQGFSKQYVGKLISQGKIKLVNGMIDERTANAVLENQRDPNLPIRRNGNGIYEQRDDMHDLLVKTKLKNEIERGKILEARAKAEIGQLISAEKVRQAMFAKGRIIRDCILNIPDRIAPLLLNKSSVSEIHTVLMHELREVLKELSQDDQRH